jgi:hypothetical protein
LIAIPLAKDAIHVTLLAIGDDPETSYGTGSGVVRGQRQIHSPERFELPGDVLGPAVEVLLWVE